MAAFQTGGEHMSEIKENLEIVRRTYSGCLQTGRKGRK